ncbi:MAG: hypothetical protein ACOCV1_06785 [Bacillota bacterium]
MVFFSKNKETAIAHAKKVAKAKGLTYVEPKLAKVQIKESKWKTWTNGWK